MIDSCPLNRQNYKTIINNPITPRTPEEEAGRAKNLGIEEIFSNFQALCECQKEIAEARGKSPAYNGEIH